MLPPRAARALLPCMLWACSGVSPNPDITEVTPTKAYSNRTVRFTLSGHSFVPATLVDPASGKRELDASGFSGRIGAGDTWAPLSAFAWISTRELQASLDLRDARILGEGSFTLEITDPRGARATADTPVAFLGEDTTPPFIDLLSPAPDAPFTNGSTVALRVATTDTFPGVITRIEWRLSTEDSQSVAGSCSASTLRGELECVADFLIPMDWPPQAKLTLEILAYDLGGGAPARLTRPCHLVPRPAVLALTPSQGGTMGGTEVVIKGVSLVKGTRASLNGVALAPEGGRWVDDQTLTGYVPANPKGKATLTLESPIGTSHFPDAFEYWPTPSLLAIVPSAGPPGRAVQITGTGFTAASRILFGPTLQEASPLLEASLGGDTAITGKVPAGLGPQTVWVYDPEFGFSSLVDGFRITTP
jgi:hypothetical protein